MLGRSFAGAPRLFERGEALDLLKPILASWACAYLDQIWDVSIIVLFGASFVGLVSLDDGAFGDGLGGVIPCAEEAGVFAVGVGVVGEFVAGVVDLDSLGGKGLKRGFGG